MADEKGSKLIYDETAGRVAPRVQQSREASGRKTGRARPGFPSGCSPMTIHTDHIRLGEISRLAGAWPQ
jgi:hypothetical protein